MMIPRYRDLWRFRAPLSAGEIRRTERWLATARVALTIAAEFALWMEPIRGMVYSRWLYWLLTIYLVHGVVVMLLVRFRPRSTRAFRLGRALHRHPVAGADFDVRYGAAWSFLFILRFRDGGCGLSLGALGDRGHGRDRGRTAGTGGLCGARRVGAGRFTAGCISSICLGSASAFENWIHSSCL